MTGMPTTSLAQVTLLAFALLGCETVPSSTNTAPKSPAGSPHHFHSDWDGLDFSYPARWKEKQKERESADIESPTGCVVFFNSMISVEPETPQKRFASLPDDLAVDYPKTPITNRPPWAGPQQPVGGYQLLADPAKHVHETVTVFDQSSLPLEVVEEISDNDASCAQDIRFFESTLRLSKPNRHF